MYFSCKYTNLESSAIIDGHARRALHRSVRSQRQEGIQLLATGELHEVGDGHWCLRISKSFHFIINDSPYAVSVILIGAWNSS